MAGFVEVVRCERNHRRKNSDAIGKHVRPECTIADQRPRGCGAYPPPQDDLDAIVARAYTAMEEPHLVFTRLGKPGTVSWAKVTLS